EPPEGAGIPELPEGYETHWMGSNTYYHCNGAYYRHDPIKKTYLVTRPPEGLIVNSLPFGFETIISGGSKRFFYMGVYYTPVTQNGLVVYKVAK
ncbi:MAG TPA: DUF6515 family protein, partial [Candidatus Deferrimicrobium sp.]|nr:DUF6515 family protein [Candidatus Deferrimicrobium sp.]